MVKRAAKADEMIPIPMPKRKWVSKWKISRIPARVSRLKSTSRTEMRCRLISGSKKAVKKPTKEKQTTPTEMFEALMLPKKKTQWLPNSRPAPAIFRISRHVVFYSRWLNHNTI